MHTQVCRRVWCTVPGVILAAAALTLAPRGEGWASLPVGPFGFVALVVVHLLTAWPVSLGVAGFWSSSDRPRRGIAVGALLVGVVIAAWTHQFGDDAWRAFLGRQSNDFALGWFARELWAFALLTPWCVAACNLFPTAAPSTATVRDRVVTLLCAALFATIVPASYANYLLRQQSKVLEARLQEGRFVGTIQLAAQLNSAGSSERIANQEIGKLVPQLAEHIANYERALESAAPNAADENRVIQLAAMAAALGKYGRAAEILGPLTATNASAALLLGSILDDQNEHAKAAVQFQAAIALAAKTNPPQANELFVQAYDGLAETLRDDRRIQEAEAAYLAGIEAVPNAEAHFRFQLGRHYALGGRFRAASESFHRAAAMDPQHFGLEQPEMQQQLRLLDEGTPGCLLPVPEYRQPLSGN